MERNVTAPVGEMIIRKELLDFKQCVSCECVYPKIMFSRREWSPDWRNCYCFECEKEYWDDIIAEGEELLAEKVKRVDEGKIVDEKLFYDKGGSIDCGFIFR